MQRSSLWRRVLAVVLFAALPLLCSRPAAADDTEQRVEHMVKRAMDDYDALEFNSAQRTLVDAITKLRSAGLDQTPLAAKTHMSLGIVYVAGLHDRGRGQQQFERALAIDPTIKLDPAVATPELQQTFDAALQSLPRRKRQQAQDGQAGQAPGTPSQGAQQPLLPPPLKTEPNAPTLSPTDALQHNPVEEAGAGQRVPVYAHPLVSVAKAVLFYRGLGQGGYNEAAMGRSKKVPGDIVGYIPHDATTGSTVQYYIEAYDLIGSVVGRQGSADSPFIISLSGGKPPPPPGDDREDPLAGMRRQSAEGPRSRVYFDIALGSGLAFISSGTTTEVAYYKNNNPPCSTNGQYVPAQACSGGSIWSGLGLRVEGGAYLWHGLTLGASLRFEPYLNQNADSAANTPNPMFPTTSKGQFGFAGLAKLRYEFRRHTIFHPYVHFDLGGGVWRGALDLSGLQLTDACSAIQGTAAGNAAGCTPGGKPGYNSGGTSTQLNVVCPAGGGSCLDSVEMGKFMIGGGGGFYVGGKHAGLTVDLNLLFATGGAQFGTMIDVYAGPAFIF